MEDKVFDVIVIGTGQAGGTVASLLAKEGQDVAIIDSHPFGGTCALRGCAPKKILVGGAEAVDFYNRMNGKGTGKDEQHLDWKEIISFKHRFTDPIPQNTEDSYDKQGIVSFHGRVHFVDNTRLEVNDTEIAGGKIVIASGAKPRPLSLPGGEHLITSAEFMDLDELPERILFAGGGYISFEFAHIAARTDLEIAILHRSEKPLKNFDPALVDMLLEVTEAVGIRFINNTPVKSVEKKDDSYIIYSDTEKQFAADIVIHGAGRVPEIDDLDLESGNVERSRKGIEVNEYLQSVSNPNVYAAGDAVEVGLPLSPTAAYHGRIVAQNIIAENTVKPDHSAVPSMLFTYPPLGIVGMTEQQAKEKGINFRVSMDETTQWYSSMRVNEHKSAYKLLIDKDKDKLIGAHILGHGAEEVINILTLAMRNGLTTGQIKQTLFTYPTYASDIRHML